MESLIINLSSSRPLLKCWFVPYSHPACILKIKWCSFCSTVHYCLPNNLWQLCTVTTQGYTQCSQCREWIPVLVTSSSEWLSACWGFGFVTYLLLPLGLCMGQPSHDLNAKDQSMMWSSSVQRKLSSLFKRFLNVKWPDLYFVSVKWIILLSGYIQHKKPI